MDDVERIVVVSGTMTESLSYTIGRLAGDPELVVFCRDEDTEKTIREETDTIRGLSADIIYLDLETTDEEILERVKKISIDSMNQQELDRFRKIDLIDIVGCPVRAIASVMLAELEPQKAVDAYAEEEKPFRFKPSKRDMQRENRRQMQRMRGRR